MLPIAITAEWQRLFSFSLLKSEYIYHKCTLNHRSSNCPGCRIVMVLPSMLNQCHSSLVGIAMMMKTSLSSSSDTLQQGGATFLQTFLGLECKELCKGSVSIPQQSFCIQPETLAGHQHALCPNRAPWLWFLAHNAARRSLSQSQLMVSCSTWRRCGWHRVAEMWLRV